MISIPAEATICVPHDHPCLPGHFPSAPVVPGVVVLDRVLELLPAPADHSRSLAWVKFLKPLFPGQCAAVTFVRDGARTRFTVSFAGDTLVSGIVSVDDARVGSGRDDAG